MAKAALFPGSFDPFTIGHDSVVERSLKLFDRVVIGIGENSSKNYLFSIDQRLAFINSVAEKWGNQVEVVAYSGLTTDYCRKHELKFIIRGIRNSRDFQYEKEIAGMNMLLDPELETVMIVSAPEHVVINATIVREIYRNNGDVTPFLPLGSKLPEILK
ncbi:MAG: pantetheine-phosphate adenylyltransferase [Vicingaceae bacterium]